MTTPAAPFRRVVTEHTSSDGWVVDGNDSAVADITTSRADTNVWIDLDRTVTMTRVLRRTLRRMVRREEVWIHLRSQADIDALVRGTL